MRKGVQEIEEQSQTRKEGKRTAGGSRSC